MVAGSGEILAAIPGPGLLFGLMLVAAIIGGYAARSLHVPRVVGFLVGGVILRVVLYELLVPDGGAEEASRLEAAAAPLKAIKDLALGLILFAIGGVFERSQLRAAGRRVLRIGSVETALTTSLVFGGCAVAALLTQWHHGLGQNLILAGLLALAAIATAPAATVFVLREYDAKGPITSTILGLTGMNNIICIVLFHTTFLLLASSGAIVTSGPLSARLWPALFLTTLGSVGLGLALGTLISIIHARLPLPETLLIFFALFILLGAGEVWLVERHGLSYNFLLTALVIGGIYANVAIDSEKLNAALHTVASPVFASFFVMAGYDLHLSDLTHLGWVGGAYVLCRFVGKVAGGHFGVRWARAPQRADGRLGSALLCQAAVVIGLASFVTRNWISELAQQFATVILGSVVLFEFIGPVLVKGCVVHGGEVKAITLLRRRGAVAEEGSIVRLTLDSLRRLFGLQWKGRARENEVLQARHIMRTNVQFIPAAETFDAVLHHIERSTYNHFPVVHEDGTLAGVLHFSDVRDVIYDPLMRDLVTAVDLADPDSVIVPMDLPLGDLLEVFTGQNVGVLPVAERADSRRVVGIVEQRDLLAALRTSQHGR